MKGTMSGSACIRHTLLGYGTVRIVMVAYKLKVRTLMPHRGTSGT